MDERGIHPKSGLCIISMKSVQLFRGLIIIDDNWNFRNCKAAACRLRIVDYDNIDSPFASPNRRVIM